MEKFKSSNMENKNLNLRDFGKIFKDLDIVLVNLQYGDVEDEIREFDKINRDRIYAMWFG